MEGVLWELAGKCWVNTALLSTLKWWNHSDVKVASSAWSWYAAWGKFKINSSSCILIQLQTVIGTYLACFTDLALISKILTRLIPFQVYSFNWNRMRLVTLFTAGTVTTLMTLPCRRDRVIIFTTDLFCRSDRNLSQDQEINVCFLWLSIMKEHSLESQCCKPTSWMKTAHTEKP